MENNTFQISSTTIYRAINDGKLEEGKLSHGARGIARKLRHRDKEFAAHKKMATELGVEFYFPNPHAPWERGTNENTNGLIREYCPKSVDMESFDECHFDLFTDKLNLRPRKCLRWKYHLMKYFSMRCCI